MMAGVLRSAHRNPVVELRCLVRHCLKYPSPPSSSHVLPQSTISLQRQSSTTTDSCGDQSKIYSIREVRKQLSNMVGTRTEWGTDKIVAGSGAVLQPIVEDQDLLPRRRPSESYAQAMIPLGDDPKVREKYLTLRHSMRFGRLLEDFDTMAGMVCYKHNRDPSMGLEQRSPFAFVTALVDRIDIDPSTPISPMKNIHLDGNVTWVGRSSMECTMHMSQKNGDSLQRLITAQYLFVARNPLTKRAAVVSPLDPQTDEEKELFKKGEASKQRRVAEGLKSLLKVPPTEEERLIIHDKFLTTVDLKSGTLKSRIKPPNTVWMEETTLKTLAICQPEQRNLYNKIFGGFLMRKAYELAWTSACLYAKTHPPMCKTVDDIVFRRPVEIGSLLFLSSQIVYTQGCDLQIKVHAEVVNPETGQREVTNDFHFTFDTGVAALPQVLPKTYAEAMLYVDGKRHYES